MQWTDEHQAFRASVTATLTREITPHIDEWEDAGIFPGHRAMKGTRWPPSHASRFAPRRGPMLACPNCFSRS